MINVTYYSCTLHHILTQYIQYIHDNIHTVHEYMYITVRVHTYITNIHTHISYIHTYIHTYCIVYVVS